MRGRRRVFGRARRRTVAWIDGLSFFDNTGAGASERIFSPQTVDANGTVGVSLALTTVADLNLHGGEDAVFTRMRGRIWLCVSASGAARNIPVLVTISQKDVIPSSGVVLNIPFVSGEGLGRDDILWQRAVQSCFLLSSHTGNLNTAFDFIELDVRAKRKLQADRQLFIDFQWKGSIVADTLQVAGTARMLLMRSK